MSGKNELYDEAMKNSGKLREVITGLSQEQAERISLYYAIGYMGSTPEEIEEAQSWQDQRWRDELDEDDEAKPRDIEEAVGRAKVKGARVFRFVLIKNGLTFTSEAMYGFQFLKEWDTLKDDIDLNRVEYGLMSSVQFEYIWHTF